MFHENNAQLNCARKLMQVMLLLLLLSGLRFQMVDVVDALLSELYAACFGHKTISHVKCGAKAKLDYKICFWVYRSDLQQVEC